jgi:hypothetical protein
MQFLPHLGSEPVAIEFAPYLALSVSIESNGNGKSYGITSDCAALRLRGGSPGHSALARGTGPVAMLLREEGQPFGLKGVSIPAKPE